MNQTYLLGIDHGGTYSKAAIFDQFGNQLYAAKANCPVQSCTPGIFERDMEAIWEANCTCIQQVMQKAKLAPHALAGVCVCGHGKGLYLLDDQRKALYPGIMSMDNRAKHQAELYRTSTNREQILTSLITEPIAAQAICLLAWMKEHEPDVYHRIRWVLSIKDYIRYRFTNEVYADYTDSSGNGLLNLYTKQYDRELLKALGIEEIMDKLPPLKHSDEVCGYIHEQAAKETGLPCGCLVANGAFDIDACSLAAGLLQEDTVCMIAGTWGIHVYLSKSPVLKGDSLHSLYCADNCYLIEESSPTSAGNLEWWMKHMLPNALQRDYDYVNRLVESCDPLHNTIMYLPFLYGSFKQNSIQGTLCNVSSQHTLADVFFAIYEGIAFAHTYHMHRLLEHRSHPSHVRLVGGVTNSPVWVQMFADILGMKIEVLQDSELGAHGAAMLAGIASGVYMDAEDAVAKSVHVKKVFTPDRDRHAHYQKKYQRFLQRINALSE